VSIPRSRARDRVALITWPAAEQGRVNATVRLEWDRIRKVHGTVSRLSVIGYGFAQALRDCPVVNRRVALWKIHNHKTVRLSFAVDAHDDGLRIAVVNNANLLDPRQFQRALIKAVREARTGKSPLATAIALIEWLPVVIGRPVVRIGSLITAGFGIGLIGVPGAPFGAVLISSLERFNVGAVTVPFVPFTRCAMVCSVGALIPTPIVRNGKVDVVDIVEISVTIDHRIADGSQLAEFLDAFESACYTPSQHA
jgi:hypothetical protein